MQACLFCKSEGPYSSVEHIIPESLGNDDLILEREVCDPCNSYFGQEVEQYVLEKSPLAFWRSFLRIRTKQGKEPSVNMSQPNEQKGVFPAVHPDHDDVGFTSHKDTSVSVDVHDAEVVKEILEDEKSEFRIVMTPKMLQMLGRFLCKVGLELLCFEDPIRARSSKFDAARRYAREGNQSKLWPIFHYSSEEISNLKKYLQGDQDVYERVTCYSFSLAEFRDRYTLFGFSIGTDNWIVSLNDPYPTPEIREAIPGGNLRLIWYADEQW